MSLDYNIKFTDTTKPGIIILPTEQNNDTTLTLFGRDFDQWGLLYNENIVNLLNNWHNDYEPGYPGQVLEGQFWYDQLTDKLRICVSSDPLEWDVVANEESPPLKNYVTSINFNKVMDHYIPVIGNTIPAGPILVKMDISDPTSLITKKYVETLACTCSKNKLSNITDQPFIKQIGDNITTRLVLIDDASDVKNGLTRKRVKANVFMGYNIHTDSSKIFKSITDLIVAPNAIMASTVECGQDLLVTISGEFSMADGKGEGTFVVNEASEILGTTFPKNDVDSYYVLVQGAATNGSSVANTGKANEIYVSEISPPNIKIKREVTTGISKGYITIYWTIKQKQTNTPAQGGGGNGSNGKVHISGGIVPAFIADTVGDILTFDGSTPITGKCSDLSPKSAVNTVDTICVGSGVKLVIANGANSVIIPPLTAIVNSSWWGSGPSLAAIAQSDPLLHWVKHTDYQSALGASGPMADWKDFILTIEQA